MLLGANIGEGMMFDSQMAKLADSTLLPPTQPTINVERQ